MTEVDSALDKLIVACWKDMDLKARFIADPRTVLKEHGMSVPDGTDIRVFDLAEDCVHIALPAPPDGHEDLPDSELQSVVGGGPGGVCDRDGLCTTEMIQFRR